MLSNIVLMTLFVLYVITYSINTLKDIMMYPFINVTELRLTD